jgi:hypothetical protein
MLQWQKVLRSERACCCPAVMVKVSHVANCSEKTWHLVRDGYFFVLNNNLTLIVIIIELRRVRMTL